jgi:acyl CoA:acetate/3-ketoacid CoA transferase beta subunit
LPIPLRGFPVLFVYLGCVDLIVTNYAVIEVKPKGLVLKEIIPGVTEDDIKKMTAAPLIVADDLHEFEL